MLSIKRDTFSKSSYIIRYLSIWDKVFDPISFSGSLLFFYGDPQYIVNVDIWTDKEKIQDIWVTLSSHNPANVEDLVKSNEQKIFEICKNTAILSFALDLKTMKIIERKDFVQNLPVHGLRTLFIFEGIDKGVFYCLNNGVEGFRDVDIYSWMLAYIYSSSTCLAPEKHNSELRYGKQLMHALSCFCVFSGDRSKVNVPINNSIHSPHLGNIGENLLQVPGKTVRFYTLLGKAKDEMQRYMEKKNKQSKLLGAGK